MLGFQRECPCRLWVITPHSLEVPATSGPGGTADEICETADIWIEGHLRQTKSVMPWRRSNFATHALVVELPRIFSALASEKFLIGGLFPLEFSGKESVTGR